MPLLVDVWPTLAAEIRLALLDDVEADLAEQIQSLEVVAPCGCGDSFCQSFYTVEKTGAPWGDGHLNVAPRAPWPGGYLILDVVLGVISYVEVLYRQPLD